MIEEQREPLPPVYTGRHCDGGAECITCSDEGIPMRVVALSAIDGIAWCIALAGTDAEIRGELTEVMIGVVVPVEIGDTLLVHAGTALLKLSPSLDRVGTAGAP